MKKLLIIVAVFASSCTHENTLSSRGGYTDAGKTLNVNSREYHAKPKAAKLKKQKHPRGYYTKRVWMPRVAVNGNLPAYQY